MVNLKEPTILVVDDDTEVRELLKNFLQRRGYLVVTAENGTEGLEKITQYHIDIIVSDIVMPGMNGLEFLQKLREQNCNAQVIMVTGSPTRERCVSSIENHACEYLIKPVTREDILRSIMKARRNIYEQQEMLERQTDADGHNGEKTINGEVIC